MHASITRKHSFQFKISGHTCVPAYVCVCVSLSLSLPLRVSAGQPQLLFLAFQDPGPELLVEPQVVFVNQFKC